MSAIDSQDEEPFDDESDFSEQSSRMPMVKIGDVAKLENVNLKKTVKRNQHGGISEGHFSSQSIWMISRTKFQSLY